MLEFGCLRKLVIAGCFACSLASAVCPSLAIWCLRSASPWWAHDKVWLQTLQWNKDLSEVTEETKGYFTVQYFFELAFVFCRSWIFGLLHDRRVRVRLWTEICHFVWTVHITRLAYVNMCNSHETHWLEKRWLCTRIKCSKRVQTKEGLKSYHKI